MSPGPRVGIVGAGIAGSLLAWRLAAAHPDWRVELLGAPAAGGDATGVSGGLVRGFETDPAARRLAADSLAELLASPTLRAWSGFRQIGSVYLVDPADGTALAAATDWAGDPTGAGRFAASVLDADGLAAEHGWAGLPEGCLGVVEPQAGNISPDLLRQAVYADLTRRGVPVRPEPVAGVRPEADGGATVRTGAGTRGYHAVVVAAGRWTARLLTDCGLPGEQYRVKLLQYGQYQAAGPPPPAFVDDTTGLYGRGHTGGQVLLGIPIQRFDIDPDNPQPDLDAQRQATELARSRLPSLRLGRLCRVVAGADCYTEPAGLRLRELPSRPGRVYTFTGGSGGSAKLALAASAAAAGELAGLLDAEGLPRRRAPALI